MKFYRVVFCDPTTRDVLFTISGQMGRDKMSAIRSARKKIDVPPQVMLLGFATELRYRVGDSFPPEMFHAREAV